MSHGYIGVKGPYEHHRTPCGWDMYFRTTDHTYHTEIRETASGWVGKGRHGNLPSPSSIAKFADPNFENLIRFAVRTERGEFKDYELALLAGADALGVDTTDLAPHEILRDAKGIIGTIAHKAFEDALQGIRTEWEGLPRFAEAHALAAQRFLKDHPDFELLQRENVVYSKKHGYAGRFDARIRWDDKTYLVDMKTGWVGRSAHQQLHAYDLAAEECGYGASDVLLILQTFEDGHYTAWPVHSSREAFLHSLALWKDGKETDRAMSADMRKLTA